MGITEQNGTQQTGRLGRTRLEVDVYRGGKGERWDSTNSLVCHTQKRHHLKLTNQEIGNSCYFRLYRRQWEELNQTRNLLSHQKGNRHKYMKIGEKLSITFRKCNTSQVSICKSHTHYRYTQRCKKKDGKPKPGKCKQKESRILNINVSKADFKWKMLNRVGGFLKVTGSCSGATSVVPSVVRSHVTSGIAEPVGWEAAKRTGLCSPRSCWGVNCVPPKLTCRSPNAQDLGMGPHWEMGLHR